VALSNIPFQPPLLQLERRELSIMIVLIVIVAVVVVLVLALWLVFNGLVKRRNRTEEAWSEIDVELKRRHDLIPNLVTAVRAYASHERGTLEAVTLARSQAVSAAATGDPSRIAFAESSLSGALRSLFAVAENYPQLRAVEGFVQLQESLTSTEDKVEYARRYYNTSARDYNIRLQTFPQNLIARSFGFKKVMFFEAEEGDRSAPELTSTSAGLSVGSPLAASPVFRDVEGSSPSSQSKDTPTAV
jgi:LemA protein